MRKIDKVKVFYVVMGVILATLFVFKEHLIPKPIPEATVTLSHESDEQFIPDVESSTEVMDSQETPGGLIVRHPHFQQQIQEAYANEETIEWARDFILLFYETTEQSLAKETYTPYVSNSVAEAIVKEKQQQFNDKVERKQNHTTFQILSVQPLKISYEVHGKRNGQAEHIVYEVLLNDSLDQIISVVQVATP